MTLMARQRPSARLGWMLPAGASLIAGLNAALTLLELPAPLSLLRFAGSHGMLLALGFVGALVALERATALGRWWGYLAPGLLSGGALITLVDALPIEVGQWIIVGGAIAFTATYVPLWRRRYDLPLLTQLIAAGIAGVAALMWAFGTPMLQLVPWLTVFVVFTIAGERVELATITLGATGGRTLLVHTVAALVSLGVSMVWSRIGVTLLGIVLASLTVWLARNDIARHTIRSRGAPRFMAACMLAAYFWLAVASVILLFGLPEGRPLSDALTHAVFLGFTFSMIMAHATTILPAVLRITLPYTAWFWIPATLLHLGLIVRIGVGAPAWGSDLGTTAWQTGGVINIVALLIFVITALIAAIIGTVAHNRKVASRATS